MKAVTEKQVRECFKIILNGKGTLIPRIAVKVAIDRLFLFSDDPMPGSKPGDIYPRPEMYGKSLEKGAIK